MHVSGWRVACLWRVAAHIMALHELGSNNPDGIELKKDIDPVSGHPRDGIPFHPYYTVKDTFGVAVFLIVFAVIVFFAPEMGNLPDRRLPPRMRIRSIGGFYRLRVAAQAPRLSNTAVTMLDRL